MTARVSLPTCSPRPAATQFRAGLLVWEPGHREPVSCESHDTVDGGGFNRSAQRPRRVSENLVDLRGDVDDCPSEHGATAVGPAAECQGPVVAGDRPAGRLFA